MGERVTIETAAGAMEIVVGPWDGSAAEGVSVGGEWIGTPGLPVPPPMTPEQVAALKRDWERLYRGDRVMVLAEPMTWEVVGYWPWLEPDEWAWPAPEEGR